MINPPCQTETPSRSTRFVGLPPPFYVQVGESRQTIFICLRICFIFPCWCERESITTIFIFSSGQKRKWKTTTGSLCGGGMIPPTIPRRGSACRPPPCWKTSTWTWRHRFLAISGPKVKATAANFWALLGKEHAACAPGGFSFPFLLGGCRFSNFCLVFNHHLSVPICTR